METIAVDRSCPVYPLKLQQFYAGVNANHSKSNSTAITAIVVCRKVEK